MSGARVRIRWAGGEIFARIDDSPAGRALLDALPADSVARTWGEEVYFPLPMECELEAGASDVVDPGTVCFWVEGGCLALPWGRTPASRGKECRLVAPVNRLGRLEGDPAALAGIPEGARLRVEAAD